MRVEELVQSRRVPSSAGISIWDTQYVPPSKAFGLYREAVCKVYMPWSPEFKADREFHARVEALPVGGDAWVSRIRCTPHTTLRTLPDIANSPRECLFVAYFLSGQHQMEKGGRANLAKPGDVLVCDSSEPLRVTMNAAPQDFVVLTVPKAHLDTPHDPSEYFSNTLLGQNRTPLANCMSLIGQRMVSASAEELTSLYNACLQLLPLEGGIFDDGEQADLAGPKAHYLLRQILTHIDANIASAELSPHEIAKRFGISVRYVHKLFIACGATFCSYVTAKRLDYVRKDLVSPPSRHLPISFVAYRWGFNDLSSFNRSFKIRFGCTPSNYRLHGGC